MRAAEESAARRQLRVEIRVYGSGVNVSWKRWLVIVRRLLIAASLLAVVAAPAAGAADTRRHAIPEAGGSIAVPADWKTVDSRLVTDSAAFKRYVDQNPSLRPFVAAISGPGSVIKLMAFDLPAVRKFVTNVNVVVTRAQGGVTLDQIAAVYPAQLKALLTTLRGPVSTRLVSLPAGKALQATYQIVLTFDGRRTPVQQRQYILLHGGKNLVITFSTLPDLMARRSANFTAIARSLRFG